MPAAAAQQVGAGGMKQVVVVESFDSVDQGEAAASYRKALELATNPVEREFFERRLTEVG